MISHVILLQNLSQCRNIKYQTVFCSGVALQQPVEKYLRPSHTAGSKSVTQNLYPVHVIYIYFDWWTFERRYFRPDVSERAPFFSSSTRTRRMCENPSPRISVPLLPCLSRRSRPASEMRESLEKRSGIAPHPEEPCERRTIATINTWCRFSIVFFFFFYFALRLNRFPILVFVVSYKYIEGKKLRSRWNFPRHFVLSRTTRGSISTKTYIGSCFSRLQRAHNRFVNEYCNRIVLRLLILPFYHPKSIKI